MERVIYKRTLQNDIVSEARSSIGGRACDHNSHLCLCGGLNCTEFVFKTVSSVFEKKGFSLPKYGKIGTTALFDSGFLNMGFDIDWEEVESGDVYFKSSAYALLHMGIVEKVYKGRFNSNLGKIDPVIDGIDSQGICGGYIGRKRNEQRVETLASRPWLKRNYRYNLRALRIAPYNPTTGWHEV